MLITNVNNNKIINKPIPAYYHCFKLSDSSYALFDIKMDMPMIIGSSTIITSTKLNKDSSVFLYEINSHLFFEKPPSLYMKMNEEHNVVHRKPPLRYHYIDKKSVIYYVFKMTPTLYVIFDTDFSMPLAYGSVNKIQAVLNNINENSQVFYYREDMTIKNSFKIWYVYKNKKLSYLHGN